MYVFDFCKNFVGHCKDDVKHSGVALQILDAVYKFVYFFTKL